MALPITLKTPGVYITETNAFPNSVVGVETSIPAFIGYTEKAEFGGQSLKNKPVRIESFNEFELFFGKGFTTTYNLSEVEPKEEPKNYDFRIKGKSNEKEESKPYFLKEDPGTKFNLYNSLKFFYQNGGGSCFIVSVGSFTDKDDKAPFNSIKPFMDGIDLLKKETEPTMIVVPDAVLFGSEDCYRLQEYMLNHCGEQMDKVAILDIHEGYKGLDDPIDNPIDKFRNNVSSNYLNYGAAYYPWLNTSIVQPSEVDYKNLNDEGIKTLTSICKTAIHNLNEDHRNELVEYIDLLSFSDEDTKVEGKPKTPSIQEIHDVLSVRIPEYKIVMENILKKINLLPPSAAMAGIYTAIDAQRGVWKAPANVAVSSVVSPAVLIDHEQQEDLNAPILGKAICAIRPFIGLGTMVWGARTLDANSLDWRYMNVRRTVIMLEQSLKFAAKAYVFEPNVKNTWVSIESMIGNFLTNLWKQGALAGAVPADAFSVSVGLGVTMTANDILEGIMRIEVKVAVSRPAEFIVISFEQQMQKS